MLPQQIQGRLERQYLLRTTDPTGGQPEEPIGTVKPPPLVATPMDPLDVEAARLRQLAAGTRNTSSGHTRPSDDGSDQGFARSSQFLHAVSTTLGSGSSPSKTTKLEVIAIASLPS